MSLFGLGDPTPNELQLAAEALVRSGAVTVQSARAYFLVLPEKSWGDAGLALINKGVASTVVYEGMRLAKEQRKFPWKTVAGVATIASAALSAAHGYRRNQSVGWGLWWFVMGTVFPIVTPTIAVAQGYGKKRER
jgi:hypothetical protein